MPTDNTQHIKPQGGVIDESIDPQEYARLLDLYDSSFRNIAEGEVMKGTVLKVTPSEVIVDSEPSAIGADAVLLLTGYQADPEFLRRAGIHVDTETRVPKHDPMTFETNVRNVFIAGGQLAGRRTGTVFIENGRFHGERIAKVLAERLA